ncbi:hypothetical protein LEP3755_62690 (plasmid) [Leptolyngbya sp. NIES-3755]|nr:hypothetical protein LEP3755_62690 [Leptolyngbya sp. NIES-3755]
MSLSVPLLRIRDLQIVEAVLIPMTDKHLEEAERLWIPLLRDSDEEDEYWNWVRKQQREALLPGVEFYAIECENVTQGLIAIDILKKRCQIDLQFRHRLVYILALATAPWNRPTILDPPLYKGVGGQFVDFAIARSRDLGYQGRIGLHALPRALNFYRKLRVNLLECGSDPDDPEHLVYFERFGDRDD